MKTAILLILVLGIIQLGKSAFLPQPTNLENNNEISEAHSDNKNMREQTDLETNTSVHKKLNSKFESDTELTLAIKRHADYLNTQNFVDTLNDPTASNEKKSQLIKIHRQLTKLKLRKIERGIRRLKQHITH